MTKDIRKNIDATNKLNESLDEGPIGWAKNKMAKAGQRAASKVTWGGTKQAIKQNTDVRSGAETLIKRWNEKYAANKMQRTPQNIARFLMKDPDLKMSKDDIKAAWDKTPQLTKNYGTFDQVANALKKQPAPAADPASQRNQSQGPQAEQPGERRQPQPSRQRASQVSGANYGESIAEATMDATQQMSIDVLRNLLINAIHVKNASDAEKELGDFPGDEKEPAAQQDPEALTKYAAAGGKDMDGDGKATPSDTAAQMAKQGQGPEALLTLMQALARDSKDIAAAYALITGETPGAAKNRKGG